MLITRSQRRLRIRSTTCGEPSPILLIGVTGTPIRSIAWAVPPVAITSKPRSWKRAASWVAAGLSVSVTVMKTEPSSGSDDAGGGLGLAERGREVGGDAHHLAGALHLRAEHRVGAGEAGERQHRLLDADVVGRAARAAPGRRASRPASAAPRSSPAAPRSPSRRRARCARRAGWPRSRRARRRRPPYWMLIRPITPSSSAIRSVVARISSSISSPRLSGGITQAESPEWTPASSTCCMIPAT